MSQIMDTALHSELASLGRRLYEDSLVRRDTEYLTDPQGRSIGWLLDTRMPMLRSETFREVGEVLAERLHAHGVSQVVGYGFGSYALVGAVLSARRSGRFVGGFVRDKNKPHGRHRLVEGPLDRAIPVAILDDILNSGRSALRTVSLLRHEGYIVAGIATLFNFAWSQGRSRLESEGIWVDSLLDLNLKQPGSEPTDCDSLA
jgi:orotate phosphoribosyltransferase